MSEVLEKITVTPSGQACGARVTGVDLSQPLSEEVVAEIRKAWLEHHVLAFPNQKLDHDQYLRFSQYFGDLAEDPFFNPLPGQKYICAIRREASDTGRIFAEYWHSDWSFLPEPPAGTILYSVDIPPHGGDTHFSNQHLSYESMPEDMKKKCDNITAYHSGEIGYAPGKGAYAKEPGSMDVRPTDLALKRQKHPLITEHAETGRRGLLSGVSYWIGFKYTDTDESIPRDEAIEFGMMLNEWQSKEEFMYVHKWEPDMLVMWDNRSVVHKATGGYEGYRRELHRITVY